MFINTGHVGNLKSVPMDWIPLNKEIRQLQMANYESMRNHKHNHDLHLNHNNDYSTGVDFII